MALLKLATMNIFTCNNNQYLKIITSVPINGLPKEALQIKMEVNDEDEDNKKVCTTVLDYILSADWCHGLEPTDSNGKYLFLTTIKQVPKVHEWIDDNLKEMFTKYLPKYSTFFPVEGYKFPKCGNKPHFSSQLGTYADKIKSLYPSISATTTAQTNKWNQSPLHKNCSATTAPLSLTLMNILLSPNQIQNAPSKETPNQNLICQPPHPSPWWHKKSVTRSLRIWQMMSPS